MAKAVKAAATDWKTTLAGVALAALNLYANGVSGKQVAVSSAALLLGSLAGDTKKK